MLSTLSEYVEKIYQTYLQSPKEELKAATIKLQEMTPAPMNSMLEKQPREEALEKRARRMKMTIEDVPPPVNQVHCYMYMRREKSRL